LKILQTSTLNPWDHDHGGGQLSVHDLASALAGAGHDVTVIYSTPTPVSPPSDIPYRCLFVHHGRRLYLLPVRFFAALRRIRGKVDLVHTHGYEGAFARAAVGGSVPIVATTHHPNLPSLEPLLSGPPWRRLKAARQLILAALERQSLRCADMVSAISGYSARHLLAHRYVSEEAVVRVVYHGGRLVGSRPAQPDGELVCVARLDRQKGLDTLLRAVAASGVVRRLDLLGSGPEEEPLIGLRHELGLDGVVRLRGQTAPEDVASYLRGAVALVLPSRHENFPRVALEALHAGLPVVATTAGGTPEAVRNGVEGLLVAPDDVDALGAALRRILTDKELRQRLSRGSLSRALEFTWERTARQTAALYEELLAGHP
jgi:glycosyltransferase involved in cell wall biosynthesis